MISRFQHLLWIALVHLADLHLEKERPLEQVRNSKPTTNVQYLQSPIPLIAREVDSLKGLFRPCFEMRVRRVNLRSVRVFKVMGLSLGCSMILYHQGKEGGLVRAALQLLHNPEALIPSVGSGFVVASVPEKRHPREGHGTLKIFRPSLPISSPLYSAAPLFSHTPKGIAHCS
jgi:hypothetical protein